MADKVKRDVVATSMLRQSRLMEAGKRRKVLFFTERSCPVPSVKQRSTVALDEKGLDISVVLPAKRPPSREEQLSSQAGRANRQPIAYYGECLVKGMEFPRTKDNRPDYKAAHKLRAKAFHKGKPLSAPADKPIPVVPAREPREPAVVKYVRNDMRCRPVVPTSSKWHADHGTAIGGRTGIDPYKRKR